MIPGANEAGVKRGATSVTCRLRESDAANRQDVRAITQLHLKLLGHGPMARLGELFLRRFCYHTLIRDGLMKVALYEVDGQPAGFIAYTTHSMTFHRIAIRRHLPYVVSLMAVSILRDPRVVLRLLKALRLMGSRRAELDLGRDPIGEVLAIGVLPEYRTPQFIRRTGVRIGEQLIAHVRSYLERAGVERMRMVVEAHNTPTLLFYQSLGGRFEPYEQAGEPMVQVWFDLNGRPAATPKGEARA